MTLSLTCDSIGCGPDILLLHGWGLNSEVWQPLLDRLQSHFCFHLLDLPGFGVNHQLAPDHYNLATVTELVARHLTRPTVVLGWSLGGLVAQQLALQYPQRVRALVCITSSPRFLADDNWPGIKDDVLRAFAAQLRSDPAATVERFLAIQALGSERARADIQLLKQQISRRPTANPVALKHGLNILREADLRHQLKQIECPTLRIYGRNDSLVPKAALEQIEALQPQATSMLFPKASHAPFISHADEFAEALHHYLARLS